MKPTMPEGGYYADSFEHLRDELKRLKVLLARAVAVVRARHSRIADSPLGNHVVERSEVDAILAHEDLLAARFDVLGGKTADIAHIDDLDEEAANQRAVIDGRVAASVARGTRLPLARLSADFGLTTFELEVLLLAIAPELDEAFERINAELHDDVTRVRPSVDLVLQVLCRNEHDKLQARAQLSPGSNLLHYRFLNYVEEGASASPTLLRRLLVPDESVVRFVLGQTPGVLSVGSILAPSPANAGSLAASTRDALGRFGEAVTRHDPDHFTLVLQSKRPDLLLAAAAQVGSSLDRSLLLFDASVESLNENKILIAFRDAALWDAILTLRMPSSRKPDKEERPDLERDRISWPAALAFSRRPVILMAQPGQLPEAPSLSVVWRIAVEPPDFAERSELWKTTSVLQEEDVRFLADSFQFSEGQIRSAQFLAYGAASLRNPSDPQVLSSDLLDASRELASPQLNQFAIPLTARYQWADLVLPDARIQQLRGIASRMKARATVLRDWGFGAKHTRGNGLNVLFTGGPGTGKTTAAEVLANELSLHLYQIDLSNVVSKYVGQTEKHLSAIFDEAEFGNALLFFDECDSLFGKRTELKDAHDRYANIEVNYLLQRIERYQGLVVLSTNMDKNMDDSFMRRLHEVVEFPFPSARHRALIWQRHLPDAAPKDADIDYEYLSSRFKLSGGNIANATRNAAYFAAAEASSISMRHLVRAVREEYQKQGRLILKHEFEPYFHIVQENPTGREFLI